MKIKYIKTFFQRPDPDPQHSRPDDGWTEDTHMLLYDRNLKWTKD